MRCETGQTGPEWVGEECVGQMEVLHSGDGLQREGHTGEVAWCVSDEVDGRLSHPQMTVKE